MYKLSDFLTSDKTVDYNEIFKKLPLNIRKHGERVSAYSVILYKKALELNLYSDDEGLSLGLVKFVARGVKHHDLGKAFMDPETLSKAVEYPYTDKKTVEIHIDHTSEIFESLVADETKVLSPVMAFMVESASSHHENWDGIGYPGVLAGETIPIIARITAIADAYDNMRIGTALKQPLKHKVAVADIVAQKGTRFDPLLIEAFLKCAPDFEKLFINFTQRDAEPPKKKNPPPPKSARTAVVSDMFRLMFRSILDTSFGDVNMIETDLRIIDPTEGQIKSEDYFETASQSQRIVDLCLIWIEKLGEAYAYIKKNFLKNYILVMNLSPRFLTNKVNYQNLLKTIAAANIPQKNICFCFQVLEPIKNIDFDPLRRLGLKIMIESNYDMFNGMNLLRDYEIDYLKLYRKHIPLHENVRDFNVFTSYIEMCKRFNTSVLVADVNETEELEIFKKAGAALLTGNAIKKYQATVTEKLVNPSSEIAD